MTDKPVVLFLCTHNSGRSLAAKVLLDHYAQGRVDVRSAGSEPADELNPSSWRYSRNEGSTPPRSSQSLSPMRPPKQPMSSSPWAAATPAPTTPASVPRLGTHRSCRTTHRAVSPIIDDIDRRVRRTAERDHLIGAPIRPAVRALRSRPERRLGRSRLVPTHTRSSAPHAISAPGSCLLKSDPSVRPCSATARQPRSEAARRRRWRSCGYGLRWKSRPRLLLDGGHLRRQSRRRRRRGWLVRRARRRRPCSALMGSTSQPTSMRARLACRRPPRQASATTGAGTTGTTSSASKPM